MTRRLTAVAFALLMATPLSVQAQDFMMRVDRSASAADPDDVPEVTIESAASGFQVNTGPAAVVYNAANTATGNYALSGRFTLQAPSDHTNYYGLVFGGNALDGASQNYLYFLVAQNGTFLVKHRANDETIHDIVARTEHEAVRQPDANGKSVNDLEVRVGAETVDFVVNGTVVHSAPKSGMVARTDGVYGVRVNHRIPGVLVENLSVSR